VTAERPRLASRKKIALMGAGQIGGTLALPCLQRELGDVVPVDIMEGMERLIEVELNDEERATLARSVESVRRSVEETGISGP